MFRLLPGIPISWPYEDKAVGGDALERAPIHTDREDKADLCLRQAGLTPVRVIFCKRP
jgi:hypothetical protein